MQQYANKCPFHIALVLCTLLVRHAHKRESCRVIVMLSHIWLKFFYGFTDSLYTHTFNSFVSINNSLPPSYSYSGPGTCYYNRHYVYKSGISTLNCTMRRYYTSYLLIVGRYVTVMPWEFSNVMTICEVTVIGVRQNISAFVAYYFRRAANSVMVPVLNVFYRKTMNYYLPPKK